MFSLISTDDVDDVVVEGGHLTLTRTPSLPHACDVLISQVLTDTPRHPLEVFRAPTRDDPSVSFAVFQTPDGDPFTETPPNCITPLMTFEAPSATESATLRWALDELAETSAQGRAVTLRILIGDLSLPPELRCEAEWLVPMRYRQMMAARKALRVNLALESRCRNAASRWIREKAERLLGKGDACSRWYSQQGSGLIRVETGDEISTYLVGDMLVQQDSARNPVIALTGYRTHPSCAAVFAAGLMNLAKQGVTHCTAFYDLEDDPSINDKLHDGVFLAAHFAPNRDLLCRINVMRLGEPYTTSEIAFSDLRRPGRPDGFSMLVAKAVEIMRRYNTDWFGVRKTGCEPALKLNARQ